MVWEPKKCCCGASIKTGTLILGWMGLFNSVSNVLAVLGFAAISREDFVNFCNFILEEKTVAETCGHSIIGVITIIGLTSALSIAICGMLLWGVAKFKPMMMLPFLIMQVIGIVSFGLIAVAAFIVMAYYHFWLAAFITLIPCGVVMFLEVYFFLIVRVCYKEVKQYSLAMMDGGNNIAYVEHREIPYKM